MKRMILTAAMVVAAISAASAAFAQDRAVGGAVGGAIVGGAVGGPAGAAVGAVAGAATGGLSEEARPRFRTYVKGRNVASYRYDNDVRVGAVLPSSGVTYYDVPREYGVSEYRYTVVNDRTVLVDPRSHRVIEVVE